MRCVLEAGGSEAEDVSVARNKLKGSTHPIAMLRVAFSELEGTARYLRPLTGGSSGTSMPARRASRRSSPPTKRS